jgi:hypothetical protein
MPITPDASWGRVVIHYNVGSLVHQTSFHCGSLDNGPYASPYPFVVPSPTSNLVALIHDIFDFWFPELYDTTCAMSAYSVYRNNGTAPETLIIQDNLVAPIVGASGATNNLAGQATYSFRTANGNGAKIVLLDSKISAKGKTLRSSLGTGEGDGVDAMTIDGNIRGHDGSKVIGFKQRTFDLNRALRKKYGFV